MRKILKSICSLLVVSCSLFFVNCNNPSPIPYYNSPDFTPHFLTEFQVEKQITHKISGFQFLNQDSQTICLESVKGKIHIANFMFTRCGSICPMMMENIKLFSDKFQSDTNIILLSYSVTPWEDSVSQLNWYKKQKEISNPNWHFLTGNQTDIYKLARQSYFAEEDFGYTKDSSDFLHTEHILLIDKNLRIRGIYNGTIQLDIQQMVKDVEILKKE
jgi:protein SCO1